MQNVSPWIAVAALTVIALVGVACWLWQKYRRTAAENDTHDALGFRNEEDSRRLHGEQRRDKSGRWV